MIKLKNIAAIAVVGTLFSLSSAASAGTLYSNNFDKSLGAFNHSTAAHQSGAKNMKVTYNVRQKQVSKTRKKTGSTPMMTGTFAFNKSAKTNEATMRYKIRLRKGFSNVGGKFFGIGPSTPITGCKDITNNGWSARVVIRDKNPRLYIYDQSKKDGSCGKSTNSSVTLKEDTWYNIALYVKLNSSSKKSDAQARLYVNGKEVAKRTGFKFWGGTATNVPTAAKIQRVIRTTFLGSFSPSDVKGSKSLGTSTAIIDSFSVVTGRNP